MYGSENEAYGGSYLMYEMHKLTSTNPDDYAVGVLAGVGLTRYSTKKQINTQLLNYETQIFEEAQETRSRKAGLGILLSTGLVVWKSPFILEARVNLRPGVTKPRNFFTLKGGVSTKSLKGAIGAHALWIIPAMGIYFIATLLALSMI
jgi:hypothetical protein